MCFAPQRRALFRHLNFQKRSEAEVFCTFWLRNVLRATTACNCSSLIWPAGSAPAALASLLFDPPEPQIIGKHSGSRLSYLFAHLDLLSSALLSSTLSLLSDPFHLCFSSVHTVGSLTSKLPSNIYIWDNPSHWLIFLKMVKTTNQIMLCSFLDKHGRGKRQKSSEAFGDSTKGLPSSYGSHVSLTKTIEWSSYWRMLKQHKTTAIEK